MNRVPQHQHLPVAFVVWWWLALSTSAPLFLRLLWEQTLLTWKSGRQMVGFSLAHQGQGLLLIGLIGDTLVIAWLIATAIYLLLKRKRPSNGTVVLLSIPIAAIALSFIPYDFWANLGGVE